MSAVVFAYHDVGCAGIRVLHRLKIPIAAVYTHADDPHENTWFGSVRRTCEELKLPVQVGADPNSDGEREKIARLEPTAFFSFYYRDLLKRALLELPRRGGVNLHGSLLPRYRGRAPVNWQLLHGERESGATLHYMVARADAGDIVDQEPYAIGPDDAPADVFKKLLPAAERVLARSAQAVMDGTAPRIEQMESKATTFGRRTAADGLIHWRMAAHDVRNLVRAVTDPYPGAFTYLAIEAAAACHAADRRRLTVWWTDFAEEAGSSAKEPGTVEWPGPGGGDAPLVVCGDRRRLRLTKFAIDKSSGGVSEVRAILRDGALLGAGS